MLRQTLARSAWRNGRRPASNAARAFTATVRRPAEVELTIGMFGQSSDEIYVVGSWTNRHKDGKKVSIEGTAVQMTPID